MLVLSRKVGQRFLIGNQVAITVVKISHGGVRIGIEAPAELPIVREELLARFGLMRESIDEILEESSHDNTGHGSSVNQSRFRGGLTVKK
jgi:carbon storage regulator